MSNLNNRAAEVLEMCHEGVDINQALFEVSMESFDFHEIDYGQGNTWNLQDSDQEPDMMDSVREDVSEENRDRFLNRIDMDNEFRPRKKGPACPHVAYVGPYYLTKSGHWISRLDGSIASTKAPMMGHLDRTPN
jgi:hypothetical protein